VPVPVTVTGASDDQSSWKVPVNRVFNRQADHYKYSNTSVFPLLYYNRISSSIPATVMISELDLGLIFLCLEGFFFGKISVLCALNYTLAKEV
jgi:hypothetical protein